MQTGRGGVLAPLRPPLPPPGGDVQGCEAPRGGVAPVYPEGLGGVPLTGDHHPAG